MRIFFGVGGPNKTSSYHVIGEIFDKVYHYGSLTTPAATDVQTVAVAPGAATVAELTFDVPGRFVMVDHALSRMERGLVAHIEVDGPKDPTVFDTGNARSEEHTSELQSLMRISYAVFCLKKKKKKQH